MTAPVAVEGVQAAHQLVQRVYLNAFPKAGTHLAELYIRQFAAPIGERGWLGTFKKNAWTTEWTNVKKFSELGKVWPGGGYLKGHTGHMRSIAKALWDGSICTLFVCRDLRDVAVSVAYHVLDNRKDQEGKDFLRHPGKKHYQRLDSFDDVLVAAIGGLKQYAGVVERWRYYEGWLDEKWVLPLRFHEMVNDRGKTADLILRYIAGQTAAFYGLKYKLHKADYEAVKRDMVQASQLTGTVTHRRGKAGGWVDDWSDAAERAFAKAGGHEANKRILNAS